MISATRREAYRSRLLAMMRRLTEELPALEHEAMRGVAGEAAGGFANMPIDTLDLASQRSEGDVALAILETETNTISEIADALARLDEGTFGFCEDCGEEIPRARLEPLPYARYCVGCAAIRELG